MITRPQIAFFRDSVYSFKYNIEQFKWDFYMVSLYLRRFVKELVLVFSLSLTALLFYATVAWAINSPTNLNVQADPDPGRNINLNWSPATEAVKYNLYRGLFPLTDANLGNSEMIFFSISTPNYTDSTGIVGETYYYQVTAVDVFGAESLVSTSVTNDNATISGKEFPHRGFGNLTNLCKDCHKVHRAAAVTQKILRRGPEVEVCYTCHDGTGSDYNIQAGFEGEAAHDTRIAGTLGSNIKCSHCHYAHGTGFTRMTLEKEENLCFACHRSGGTSLADGVVYTAPDIMFTFQTFEALNNPLNGVYYAHPASSVYLHTNSQDENASQGLGYWGMLSNTRHAECLDCHNPHQAKAGLTALGANIAPPALRGVSGVQVTNSAAGTVPAYTFIEAIAFEYELCFKCHSSFNSSWNTAPPWDPVYGIRRDKAAQFNFNNPSYHPVEENGKNLGVRDEAFTVGTPWNPTAGDDPDYGFNTAGSTDPDYPGKIACSQCHRNGDPLGAQGPHGSSTQHILKRPFSYAINNLLLPIESQLLTGQNDLCFECHNVNVYFEEVGQSSSRFGGNHPLHVKIRGISCFACHDPHGREDTAHLIRIKEPSETAGIVQFEHFPAGDPNFPSGGGRCWATCHGTQPDPPFYISKDYQNLYP